MLVGPVRARDGLRARRRLGIADENPCAHGQPGVVRPVERVAMLPLENLSADPESEWLGRAVSAIASARTAGDPLAVITSAFKRTSSNAKSGKRSG